MLLIRQLQAFVQVTVLFQVKHIKLNMEESEIKPALCTHYDRGLLIHLSYFSLFRSSLFGDVFFCQS